MTACISNAMMAWFGNRLLSWLAQLAARLRGVKGVALAGFHEGLGSPLDPESKTASH
jgi:hypothetical protein